MNGVAAFEAARIMREAESDACRWRKEDVLEEYEDAFSEAIDLLDVDNPMQLTSASNKIEQIAEDMRQRAKDLIRGYVE